jgi:predicted RNase H-like HicB family nuclease
MARRYYPGVINFEDGKGYGIHFHDLPGCTSAGDTLDELLANAEESVALWLEDVPADEYPAASTAEQAREREHAHIAQDQDRAILETSFFGVQYVPATLPSKSVRINLTIEEDLLKRIDAVADNRSGWIAEAAREKLAERSSSKATQTRT